MFEGCEERELGPPCEGFEGCETPWRVLAGRGARRVARVAGRLGRGQAGWWLIRAAVCVCACSRRRSRAVSAVLAGAGRGVGRACPLVGITMGEQRQSNPAPSCLRLRESRGLVGGVCGSALAVIWRF